MATTCQSIVDRAKAFSPLNASLATDPVEMLTRIQQLQQKIFTSASTISKDRFQTSTPVLSTSAASGRSVNLGSLDPPLERLLVVSLPDGRIARQVDVMDLDAELEPRYIVRAQTLVEVENDWRATTGALFLTLTYVYGATPITVTGVTTQEISLPDQWADLLIRPLAMYFHTKDPGRDPAEYETLSNEHSETWQAFLAYVTNYGGVKAQRFDIPSPTIGAKK